MSADLYPPIASLQKRALVNNLESYKKEYERSIADPEKFWSEKADDFHWYKKWDSVCSYNYDMTEGPISIKWFEGAKTNITYNCLDRHLATKGDQTAIIWEGNSPNEDETLTFKELHERVCKFSNVLKKRGVMWISSNLDIVFFSKHQTRPIHWISPF